eukprot:12608-Pyramimonas_sp.AAC.3
MVQRSFHDDPIVGLHIQLSAACEKSRIRRVEDPLPGSRTVKDPLKKRFAFRTSRTVVVMSYRSSSKVSSRKKTIVLRVRPEHSASISSGVGTVLRGPAFAHRFKLLQAFSATDLTCGKKIGEGERNVPRPALVAFVKRAFKKAEGLPPERAPLGAAEDHVRSRG